MKHVLRTIAIFAAVAFAACFGSGPVPSAPSGATIVFAAQSSTDPCNSFYIGDVAFGSDTGYAITVPYLINNNGNNGNNECSGDNGASGPLNVYQFSLDGMSSATIVGSAGTYVNMGNNIEPRILVANGSAVWVVPETAGASSPTLEPSMLAIGGAPDPVGMATDSTEAIYVATAQSPNQSNSQSVNSPTYPGQTNGGDNNGSPGGIYSVSAGVSTMLAAPQLVCNAVNHCLASGADALYYFQTPTSGDQAVAEIGTCPKTVGAGSASQIGSIPMGPLIAPVGIAATMTTVAWAASVDFTQGSSEVGCAITAFDLTSMQPTPLLRTNKFSCIGLALDGVDGAAYFSIVSVFRDNNNGDSGYLIGNGIGRIDLNTLDFTSVDLGIDATGAGPRRIHPLGDQLYAIDPEVIARIAKSSLVARHDFTP